MNILDKLLLLTHLFLTRKKFLKTCYDWCVLVYILKLKWLFSWRNNYSLFALIYARGPMAYPIRENFENMVRFGAVWCDLVYILIRLYLEKIIYIYQGWGQVQYLYLVLVLKYIFISTWCTWVLGVWKCQSTCTCTCTWPKSTWYLQVIFKYYLLKSVKRANYLNTLL